jgi:hyaluronoglucosaminidase
MIGAKANFRRSYAMIEFLARKTCEVKRAVPNCRFMAAIGSFSRRGIVEGFFGPLWSMEQRRKIFAFGAARGMNTYLYAPKDDPYHRKLWRRPYPPAQWHALLRLIHQAKNNRIDFVYGFHPGEGLCFSDGKPLEILLHKARRFYDAGVRTFAVLFDDILSRLTHARDRRSFKNSLALAEGTWLAEIEARQPGSWEDVEWWICPSYYSEDPLLERMFGRFERDFLEALAERLPARVACFWTGPAVVSRKITLAHARRIAKRIGHRPLLLWDNYPVNDLSMSDELHIGPLTGRDPLLPASVYGYLNNPLLQEELGFLPLATCFDYAAAPGRYASEQSWDRAVKERFGANAWPDWLAIRKFCEDYEEQKKEKKPLRIAPRDRIRLRVALNYLDRNAQQRWAREIAPWRTLMEKTLAS